MTSFVVSTTQHALPGQAVLVQFIKNKVVDYTLLSLLLVGLLYIFVSSPSSEQNFLPKMSACQPNPNSTMFNMIVYRDELDQILAEVSTENKTVIIAVANRAYVEGDKPMLDLFMDGFWYGENTRGLTDHLLIVAVDQTSYERCRFLRLHCYKLETEGVEFSGEKLYMSEDFIEMMWRRTQFLGDVLKRGYNFIFTDMDVIWLRNPFNRLSSNETIDLQVSTDKFNGDDLSQANPINTGFYMTRSNNRTISLFNTWYGRKNASMGMKEQDVLQLLVREGMFTHLGLQARFLDTLFFSGFCQDSCDVNAVVTVHSNCCRSINAKVTDLTAVLRSWKGWKAAKRKSGNVTMPFQWPPHKTCRNSWRHQH